MTTLHGEYKVIGGKLVAADLSLADGRIATASINGDFYLEPDEALEDLNAAVAGPVSYTHLTLPTNREV